MNTKQKIQKYLNLEKVEENAISVYWWGYYKYEISGLDYWKAIVNDGKSLASVYEKFYETFKPDIFNMNPGTPKYYRDARVFKENGDEYIEFQDKYMDLKKLDRSWSEDAANKIEKRFSDESFESDKKIPVLDITNRKKIDEYIKKYLYKDHDLIIELGYTDHIREISKKYGRSEFLSVSIGLGANLVSTMGFEKGMIALAQYPDEVKYYYEKSIPVIIEWAKAYKKAGLDCLAVDISTAGDDMISPRTFRDLIFPSRKEMFEGIKDTGLYPVCCFTVNVMPYVENIGKLPICGLMVDESRKEYVIDVVEITKKIGDRVCVFGNMDSQNILLFGKPEDIRKEVDRQKEAKKYGNFIFNTGSPLIPGTPRENIHEFLKYARNVSI